MYFLKHFQIKISQCHERTRYISSKTQPLYQCQSYYWQFIVFLFLYMHKFSEIFWSICECEFKVKVKNSLNAKRLKIAFLPYFASMSKYIFVLKPVEVDHLTENKPVATPKKINFLLWKKFVLKVGLSNKKCLDMAVE